MGARAAAAWRTPSAANTTTASASGFKVSRQDNQAIFEALRSLPQPRGYKQVSSKPGYKSFKDGEGFGIALESPDVSKTLILQASSPCVWSNGAPSK